MPTARWLDCPEAGVDARSRPTGLATSALLNRLAAPGVPAGGVTVAWMAAAAAGLTAMVARGRWEAEACRADGWRGRAMALMDADPAAYQGVLAARGGTEREQALEAASRVPAEVARLAAECTELAARLAREAGPPTAADARVAALTAAAAARGAAALVAENLGPEAPLARQAGDDAARAAAVAGEAG